MLTWDKIAPALILAGIGWVITEMYVLKTEVAVHTVQLDNVEVKVAENHKMLTPMWEDFLLRKSDDYVAWFNE